MNSIVLDQLRPPGNHTKAARVVPPGDVGTTGFGAQFQTRAKALAAPAKADIKPDDTRSTDALQAKIAKMLRAGASQAQIATTLAAQLAASVANELGIAGGDARTQLKALFARALAAPADGPSDMSIDGRSRALAQRFLKLADTAHTIATQTRPGQHKEFAGSLLDADSAKEIPAQSSLQDNVARAAIADADSVNAGTSPAQRDSRIVSPAQGSSTLTRVLNTPMVATTSSTSGAGRSALPAAAGFALSTGDGRTVKLGEGPALSGGGDTTLGRVLARAARAADARASTVVTSATQTPAVAKDDVTTRASSNAPSDSSHNAPADTSNDDFLTASGMQTASSESEQNSIATFVKSFETALGIDTQAETPAHPASRLAAPALHTDPPSTTAFAPALAALRSEAAIGVAASPTSAPTPIDHSAIVDQVLRGAFMRTTGSSSEMRLSLMPESLGDVTIKLIVSAGNVTAHVLAQTPDVRDALVTAQPQLAKALADSGLKLQSFTVDLSGGSFAGFSQQQNTGGQQSERTRHASAFAEDTGDDPALDATPSFGPSIATGPGDYNYLV